MTFYLVRSSTSPIDMEESGSPFLRALLCFVDWISRVPSGKIACVDRSISTTSHQPATLVRLSFSDLSLLRLSFYLRCIEILIFDVSLTTPKFSVPNLYIFSEFVLF